MSETTLNNLFQYNSKTNIVTKEISYYLTRKINGELIFTISHKIC